MRDLSYERKVRMRAFAILQRAETAGIPERYMRIPSEEFKELLSPQFHKDTAEFSKNIFENADQVLKNSFISIDGGEMADRKKAAFALLFRLIACDKFGLYRSCQDLHNKLQILKSGGTDRNELVEDLKTYDVLFISEFRKGLFNPHFDTGNLFDELLASRDDEGKTTIISFIEPINKNNEEDVICGRYLSDLSRGAINGLRVRVTKSEE